MAKGFRRQLSADPAGNPLKIPIGIPCGILCDLKEGNSVKNAVGLLIYSALLFIKQVLVQSSQLKCIIKQAPQGQQHRRFSYGDIKSIQPEATANVNS